MSVYIVTGKLGNGKTLVTVGRIRDAIRAGCRIATNLDIDLVSMFGKQGRNINLMRIPDKPNIDDLNAIGKGYDGIEYDENKFGILVLDECGTWFNSRNWQDKSRKDVNDWFLHARKLGWHVYIIIQDISMLDSQARDAIGELLVTCKRMDKIRVPFIGPMIKTLTGINVTMPRIHRAKVTYADGLVSDVWVYRGNDLFRCYDTRQSFIQNYPHGTHSLLTPWHTHGRFAIEMNWRNMMRITKIYWKRFASPVALGTGLLLGAFVMLVYSQPVFQQAAPMVSSMPVAQIQPAIKPVPNPFDGLSVYLVGDVAGSALFQVVWPDNTHMTFTESEMMDFGFDVARLSRGIAKLTFQNDFVYALPKPRAPYESQRTNVVQSIKSGADETVTNVN